VPLHVWLPDSMEGPTPISALIHAATMVTAGIFMVARMSPLFEHSATALGFVTVIGATGALFLGILGIVAFDIKRVVAYSTLSQLGYMTVALGVSAYASGMFHLMTHAFFKALLFLGAGSVIIAMHHDQDMRNMGGLRKYMPITYVTMVIGGLALCGIPPFAGFFSKDSIIEAVHASTGWGHGYAYFCVMAGVFVTAFYTFRQICMTFHGEERFRHPPFPAEHHEEHGDEHHGDPHESPWVVTVPLILLAIPSVAAGWIAIEPLLFGGYFGNSIFVLPEHDVLAKVKEEWHGPVAMIVHSLTSPVLWIALAGVVSAVYLYLFNPALPARNAKGLGGVYTVLLNNYFIDRFNEWFFAGGARRIGNLFSNVGDGKIIEGVVNGSARMVGWWGVMLRQVQSGYVYHYAFTMIVGLFALLTWWVVR
jgi:NADH-quinone oxidoreductase subunit L